LTSNSQSVQTATSWVRVVHRRVGTPRGSQLTRLTFYTQTPTNNSLLIFFRTYLSELVPCEHSKIGSIGIFNYYSFDSIRNQSTIPNFRTFTVTSLLIYLTVLEVFMMGNYHGLPNTVLEEYNSLPTAQTTTGIMEL